MGLRMQPRSETFFTLISKASPNVVAERRRWAREFSRSAFTAEPEEFAEDLLAELLRSGAAQWRDGRLLAQVPYHTNLGTRVRSGPRGRDTGQT
ncbi:MAG: hypothetical protein M3N33_05395 [Actinomycetota bacterium]|nr:hypothetical protein [Actinomycetota bacterium]